MIRGGVHQQLSILLALDVAVLLTADRQDGMMGGPTHAYLHLIHCWYDVPAVVLANTC